MTGWTVLDIPEQTGRTIVVTGANSGLGLSTSIGLARAGARVVLACRHARRSENACLEILRAAPDAELLEVHLDLSEQESARQAAADVATMVDRVDAVIANAGVMATRFARTGDGFELQTAVNHLGHFAFVGSLLPSLLASESPRVVVVSSILHRLGRVDVTDLNWNRRRYRRWAAYAQTKLANLLYAGELARRSTAAGHPILAAAVHPGFADTNLIHTNVALAKTDPGRVLTRAFNDHVAQPVDAGALSSLYAATMPDVAAGSVLGPAGPFELRGRPVPVQPSRRARDAKLARQLWEVSAELTGVPYVFPSPSTTPA